MYSVISVMLDSIQPVPWKMKTRNDRRNANRNPEWLGHFGQLVEIEKPKFLFTSRYKFKLRCWLNLNSSVSPGTNSNRDFGVAVKSINNSLMRRWTKLCKQVSERRINLIYTFLSLVVFRVLDCCWGCEDKSVLKRVAKHVPNAGNGGHAASDSKRDCDS